MALGLPPLLTRSLTYPDSKTVWFFFYLFCLLVGSLSVILDLSASQPTFCGLLSPRGSYIPATTSTIIRPPDDSSAGANIVCRLRCADAMHKSYAREQPRRAIEGRLQKARRTDSSDLSTSSVHGHERKITHGNVGTGGLSARRLCSFLPLFFKIFYRKLFTS
ncbi:hypothetical protein K440DRAFT_406783 [Wilcoxina mikolae CBS 423.85]|nr:hypothetical protein K440DRAFT_406783 [Wilcoxina mikolae CBS 423.85]